MGKNHRTILTISVLVWIFGFYQLHEHHRIVLSAIIIHLSSLAFFYGFYLWARSKRKEDVRVSFWNISEPDFEHSISRLFQLSVAISLIWDLY